METAPVRRSRRDGGITALILGFFASAWFGWGHAAPPAWLDPWLTVGSVLAILTAIAGAVVGFRAPASTAAANNRESGRRYGIIVGIEFGLAGLGGAILGATGHPAYVPVWICAVVGVHFIPLAPVLKDRGLVPLGVVVTAIAVVALIVGLTTAVAPSTITGVGTGVALLAYAVSALVGALRTE
ncbi:hypothetical protein [Hamadaea tsunoensis]|uniref:hypothetical protein n=1 Tax=Hamadaea tsunoensis TaxID=53368 RepID=UPI00040A8C3A|nr:hypothetical protein [Hamadaea tsunoensis]